MYAVSAKKSDGGIFCFPRHSFAEIPKRGVHCFSLYRIVYIGC